jgi:RHS repeat-associated protein
VQLWRNNGRATCDPHLSSGPQLPINPGLPNLASGGYQLGSGKFPPCFRNATPPRHHREVSSTSTERAAFAKNAHRGYQLLPASLPRTRTLLTTRRRWRNRVLVRRRASGRVHYNYFRDYDPASGRYVESDPIGLRGGSLSTFSFVSGNPLMRIDPLGLADCLSSCRQKCLAAYDALEKGNYEAYAAAFQDCRLENFKKAWSEKMLGTANWPKRQSWRPRTTRPGEGATNVSRPAPLNVQKATNYARPNVH